MLMFYEVFTKIILSELKSEHSLDLNKMLSNSRVSLIINNYIKYYLYNNFLVKYDKQ